MGNYCLIFVPKTITYGFKHTAVATIIYEYPGKGTEYFEFSKPQIFYKYNLRIHYLIL